MEFYHYASTGDNAFIYAEHLLALDQLGLGDTNKDAPKKTKPTKQQERIQPRLVAVTSRKNGHTTQDVAVSGRTIVGVCRVPGEVSVLLQV